MERRLAAIMAADVVSYSRLMEVDEAATLVALKAHREELIDPKVAEHMGRVVKLMGDGALIEFPSVVEAVQCALEVQMGLSDRNANIPEDRRIEFRIGVNLGDVIVDGDDIYGDGVNVAARLEALAAPGGICISDVVHQIVDGKLDVRFEDLGKQEIKNISKPVHVYQITMAGWREETNAAISHGNGSRWRWVAGAGIVTFLAVGGLYAWGAFDLGQPNSSAAGCTDHLGLPMAADKCVEIQK